ncbi:hypothetical protein CHS0354_016698 [Potamilus streckersoni]|uniref:Uncharacterized protein n=1 Tax=Potamilus streckersoni TaxID=2493646 RepID=A0AAE0SAN2_9BIVA|nr:hypothetical protein CHS0354_016698 [Potamilus streckersoni]
MVGPFGFCRGGWKGQHNIHQCKNMEEGVLCDYEENYFIAPCMLHEKTPQKIICPKPDPQIENSSVLCYVFVEKFLPTPIFHRLIAACIARWPIATHKKENQIFCGCCVFQLGQNHKLTIHVREHVIFVRVARKGIKDKTLSPKLYIEVRELITTMLNNITGNLGQNLKFEYCIRCPG